MEKSEVLAVVGEHEITRKDVEALIKSLNPQTAAQFRSESGMKNLLNELVGQELIYLDALEQGIDQDNAYLQAVEKAKADILKQYALNRLLGNIQVTENEITDFYSNNKSTFTTPPSVKASHILVDDLEKAEQIAEEIEKGLSFEDAAHKYSKCPSKEQGGDLGFFSRGKMVPEFESAAFELENEQVSAPVKTQFGYHLIKAYDKKDESLQTLEEVRGRLAEHLLAQKQQALYHQKITSLSDKYPVKVNI